MRRAILVSICVVTLGLHCNWIRQGPGHHHHGKHHKNKSEKLMHKRSIPELVKRFENPKRAAWQKPDTVIKLLKLKPGMTVADIGAGSGYFSFRLARAGANVIALDVSDGFLDHMHERKKKLALEAPKVAGRIQIKKTPYDSANLKDGEVDRVLTVNTYHHIGSRVAYFEKLKAKLKPGGLVYIIDFKEKELPVGPPPEHKISAKQVSAELTKAGYQVTVDGDSLPYQYVIIATAR